jgi:hypothetical protein
VIKKNTVRRTRYYAVQIGTHSKFGNQHVRCGVLVDQKLHVIGKDLPAILRVVFHTLKLVLGLGQGTKLGKANFDCLLEA